MDIIRIAKFQNVGLESICLEYHPDVLLQLMDLSPNPNFRVRTRRYRLVLSQVSIRIRWIQTLTLSSVFEDRSSACDPDDIHWRCTCLFPSLAARDHLTLSHDSQYSALEVRKINRLANSQSLRSFDSKAVRHFPKWKHALDMKTP